MPDALVLFITVGVMLMWRLYITFICSGLHHEVVVVFFEILEVHFLGLEDLFVRFHEFLLDLVHVGVHHGLGSVGVEL